MFVKERLDDPGTFRRICDILKPREFTRVDEIIEIIFSTAEETAEPQADDVESIEQEEAGEKVVPAAFHAACVARVETHFGKRLIRQTRSSFASPDGRFGIVCAVSKTHEVLGHPSYWFAFHPYQKDFLETAGDGFLVLGCGSAEKVFAFPTRDFFAWLPEMWTTQREERFYWHVRIHEEGDQYKWDRKAGLGRIDVTQYLLHNSS